MESPVRGAEMNDAALQRDLGRLEGEVKAIKERLTEIAEGQTKTTDTLADINKTLSEAKGGWKMFLMVGGFSAAVGGLVAKLLPFWQSKP